MKVLSFVRDVRTFEMTPNLSTETPSIKVLSCGRILKYNTQTQTYIYLGRIAEKVKYITYLGCAPARKEGSRTENWKFQED